jgi:hypothetical protein
MLRRTAHRLRERVVAMETVFSTATGVHILATVSDAHLDASVGSRQALIFPGDPGHN